MRNFREGENFPRNLTPTDPREVREYLDAIQDRFLIGLAAYGRTFDEHGSGPLGWEYVPNREFTGNDLCTESAALMNHLLKKEFGENRFRIIGGKARKSRSLKIPLLGTIDTSYWRDHNSGDFLGIDGQRYIIDAVARQFNPRLAPEIALFSASRSWELARFRAEEFRDISELSSRNMSERDRTYHRGGVKSSVYRERLAIMSQIRNIARNHN